jgi:uncharacterized protein (TIGR02246 family)
MKKLLVVIPLVFLLCFASSCQQNEQAAEEPTVDIEAEREAVMALKSEFVETLKAKDVEHTMSVFADEAMMVRTNDEFFRDKEGITKFFEGFFEAGWDANILVEKVDVSQSGDLAYMLVKLDHSRVKEDQSTGTIKIGAFIIFKKQPDGDWKIVAFL